MEKVNESKYVTNMRNMRKSAENLLGMASQLVGAVGGNELDQMVSGALDSAANLIAFAYYFLEDGTVSIDAVKGNYDKALKAAMHLKSVRQVSKDEEMPESVGIYIDPYESEYLPEDLRGASKVDSGQVVKESINEDFDNLPEELDDDPDAINITDPNGLPIKFNNTPIELDPFAVKLFRNNADLIDPPEVFTAVQGAEDTVDPEPETVGDADVVVDPVEREQVIDVIADGDAESKDDETSAQVVLPSNDFEDFANESRVIPKAMDDGLPPQFSVTEAKRANENISEDTGNNLKMLMALTNAWGDL